MVKLSWEQSRENAIKYLERLTTAPDVYDECGKIEDFQKFKESHIAQIEACKKDSFAFQSLLTRIRKLKNGNNKKKLPTE